MDSDPHSSKANPSPDEIVSSAEELCLHIEAITLYVTRRMRMFLRQLLGHMKVEFEEYDFEKMVSLFEDPSVNINIHDIESSVEHFKDHIPDNAGMRAALARVISRKYPFVYNDITVLRELLRLDSDEVKESYQVLFGSSIEEIYAAESEPDMRPFWYQLPGHLLQKMVLDLLQEIKWHYLSSDQTLFKQGDHGDSLYSIVSGRVRIVAINARGEETTRIEKGRGTLFGELAMLSEDHLRTATVYATRDTELIELTRASYERLVIKFPELGLKITTLIANAFKIAVSGTQRPSQLTTLVFLPAQEDIPLNLFVDRLERELTKSGSVFVLNSKRFDSLLGEGASQTSQDDDRNSSLLVWLTDVELAHRFVIYVTDHQYTEWTRRCLRMADRTILVANSTEDPGLCPIEQQFMQSRGEHIDSGRDLILLQPSRSRQPQETAKWFEHRKMNRHHHVHMDSPQDFARLARTFSGKALGLALSGGGARGMAHIGVIQALEEANIPIDLVGGTSFGSIIGAAMGLEWDWQQINAGMHQFIAERGKFFRPAIPYISLMEGNRLSEMFQNIYGLVKIEDLWRTSFCLASNLTRARLEVLDRGPLWSGVRASMSIPTVFPPVFKGHDMLVDGGAINNLPSDIVKDRLDGGIVIASNTTAVMSADYRYENDATSWQILRTRLNPSVKDSIPNIVTVAAETMVLASKWQQPRQYASADLMFEIPVEKYKTFDYDAVEELIETGYRTANNALEKWTAGTKNVDGDGHRESKSEDSSQD